MRYLSKTAWCLYTETQRGVPRPVIKRWVTTPDGKPQCQRLPVGQYAHFRDNPDELKSFLERLNAEHRREKASSERSLANHAFIDGELLKRYQLRRSLELSSKDRVSTEMHYLKQHFLNFFIGKKALPNPKDWVKTHKNEWAAYLLSHEVPSAPATKREIIQAANRFLAWLREERPTEVPDKKLVPISKAKFKELSARRKQDPSLKHRTFIPEPEWERIKRSLSSELAPFALLAYCYGVRRSEALGFLPGDVKKGYLSVERQLESMTPTYKPTKGKLARKVPHWYSTAAEAYLWVEQAQKWRVDPDALTDLWNSLMEALDMTYQFHDLRHSFITKAIRDHNHREVQLAAGHSDLKTTLRYAHDDRDQDEEEYKPAG